MSLSSSQLINYEAFTRGRQLNHTTPHPTYLLLLSLMFHYFSFPFRGEIETTVHRPFYLMFGDDRLGESCGATHRSGCL